MKMYCSFPNSASPFPNISTWPSQWEGREKPTIPDVFTKAKRSEVMSRIRARGNKDTELALARIFRRHGITGWRRNRRAFGKPDFVFKEFRTAVFVDGCFWHSCPKHSTSPRGNREYWRNKLFRN